MSHDTRKVVAFNYVSNKCRDAMDSGSCALHVSVSISKLIKYSFTVIFRMCDKVACKHLGSVVDDDVGVVRHDQVISEGRLVHGVLPPLVLEDAVDHGVVGTLGGEDRVRHQGAVHAVSTG